MSVTVEESRLPAGGRFASPVGPSPGVLRNVLTWSLPACLLLTAIAATETHTWAWDLRAFYNAAGAYVHHLNPYPAAHLSALTGQEMFVYPLPAAIAFIPLWILPWPVATAVCALLMVACIPATLYILGVRDRRIYAVTLLVLPTQSAVVLGALTPVLMLLLALLWRYRDRTWIAALLLCTLVVSKLFLWPLGLWLLLTRRVKSVAYATGVAVVAVGLSAIPYGFGIFGEYRDVLSLLSSFESSFSFSPLSFFLALGLSEHLAMAAIVVAALVMGAFLVIAARRRDDLLALRVSLAIAITCSPIVWGHYFLLLFVPLAIMRPRFSALWLVLGWIPCGTESFVHYRALWIGVALVLAAAQLGFMPRLPRWSFGEPAVGLGAAALLVAAMFLGYTRTLTVASLTPVGRASAANGTVMLKVKRDGSSACWRIWTQSFTGPVSARVSGPRGAGFGLPVVLGSDGSTSGCAPVADRAVARGLALNPTGGYSLTLRSTTTGVVLRGSINRRENVGKPPKA